MVDIQEIRVITEANGYDLLYLQKAISGFEAKHPHVKVDLLVADDSYAVMDHFNNGGADLLHIREGEYINRLRKGIVRDLLPFLKADPSISLEDFYKGALEQPMWENQLAALPMCDVAVPLIYYNKRLFSDADISYPTSDWTAEQFLDTAIRLTKQGETVESTQYGFYIHTDVEFLEPFVMRRGGQYVATDGSTAHGYTDSEITLSTYQWIVDLFRKYKVAPMPGTDLGRIFRTNQVAMIYGFTWTLQDVINDADLSRNYGVVGLPQFPNGEDTTMMYSTGFGIPTISKQPELAWTLLRDIAIPSEKEAHEAYWGTPITKSLAKALGRSDSPWWVQTLADMDKIQKSAYQFSAIWNRSRQKINDDINKMIVEGTDIEETVSRWAKLLD